MQLGLLDAAHVIPVEHPDGTDEPSNGVALCALHHRAYDRGLVTFEKYRILFSKARMEDLKAAGYHGGAEAFQKGLLTRLAVPLNVKLCPDPTYIKKANEVRGWVP